MHSTAGNPNEAYVINWYLYTDCRDEAMAAGQSSAAAEPTMLQRAAHHGLVMAVAAEAPAFTATAALFARCLPHSLLSVTRHQAVAGNDPSDGPLKI